MKLTLIDRKADLVEAWREAFAEFPDVVVRQGDIFDAGSCDAMVSPANCFGYMDGGIDLAYRRHFGLHLEADVMACIRALWGGILPVGEAMVIHTHDQKLDKDLDRLVRYLVVAPTMPIPGMDVSLTDNAQTAFSAVLKAVQRFNEAEGRRAARGDRTAGPLPRVEPWPIRHLVSPGLCTLTGRMAPRVAARQMAVAWREAVEDGEVADTTDGDVGPAHDCGGFALVRLKNEWTLRDYYAEGRLVFCPTCGKRLPLEA